MPLILSGRQQSVAVSRFALSEGKKATFFNQQGNVIENAKPEIPANLANAHVLQKIQLDGKTVFLDESGQVVDVSVGQATTQGVLLSQKGSLIYYGVAVNDVFAYFLTQQKDTGATSSRFPTTQADLDAIVAFAGQHQKTFPDPNALAVEIKTSWVETKGLPDAATYIRMNATIPTFDTTDPNDWKQNGERTAELALIGIHVVGSTNGHPEMIWATFEHFSNTPNAAYTYNSMTGPCRRPKHAGQATPRKWRKWWRQCPADQFNIPSKRLRELRLSRSFRRLLPVRPWPSVRATSRDLKALSAAANRDPNPLGNTTALNTEIISINNSVLGQLVGNDLRKGYYGQLGRSGCCSLSD